MGLTIEIPAELEAQLRAHASTYDQTAEDWVRGVLEERLRRDRLQAFMAAAQAHSAGMAGTDEEIEREIREACSEARETVYARRNALTSASQDVGSS